MPPKKRGRHNRNAENLAAYGDSNDETSGNTNEPTLQYGEPGSSRLLDASTVADSGHQAGSAGDDALARLSQRRRQDRRAVTQAGPDEEEEDDDVAARPSRPRRQTRRLPARFAEDAAAPGPSQREEAQAAKEEVQADEDGDEDEGAQPSWQWRVNQYPTGPEAQRFQWPRGDDTDVAPDQGTTDRKKEASSSIPTGRDYLWLRGYFGMHSHYRAQPQIAAWAGVGRTAITHREKRILAEYFTVGTSDDDKKAAQAKADKFKAEMQNNHIGTLQWDASWRVPNTYFPTDRRPFLTRAQAQALRREYEDSHGSTAVSAPRRNPSAAPASAAPPQQQADPTNSPPAAGGSAVRTSQRIPGSTAPPRPQPFVGPRTHWFADTDRDHQREQAGRFIARVNQDVANHEADFCVGAEQRARTLAPGASDQAIGAFVDAEWAAVRGIHDGFARRVGGEAQDALVAYGNRVEQRLRHAAYYEQAEEDEDEE